MIRAAKAGAGAELELSDDCVGTAQCVAAAPDVFRLGPDGLAG